VGNLGESRSRCELEGTPRFILLSRKKNVKAIIDDLNKLLGFYKKMKAYIADHGIDKALVQYEKAKQGLHGKHLKA